MSRREIFTCDRPGCGVQIQGQPTVASVTIREPPYANLGEARWDLCATCADELRQSRIGADLAFGDRFRKALPE